MDSKVLHHLTYGVYLLTARQMGVDNGCIINTAVQVANNPARISISVIKGGKTHDMIHETGAFHLSALTQDAPFSLFQRFGMQSGRDMDKFEGFEEVDRSDSSLLYLTKYASMYLCAVVEQEIDLGSHTLFIAEVVDGKLLGNGIDCSYSYYQSNIKPHREKTQNPKWECTVCGYVYEGEEVPEDFLCPICFHPKADFVKM